MTKVYKSFKKSDELFMGLGLWTWLKIVGLTSLLIYTAVNLKLSINSPLLLFFAIFWMIVCSFVIKASLDDEVPGFYSSFVTHPFKDHLFKSLPDENGYQSILDLHNLKEIKSDCILSKEGDLIAILKLNNGIPWNKSTKEDREQILENWAGYLGQIQSIDSINSYLLNSNLLEDSLQCFVWVKPYQLKAIPRADHAESNLNEAEQVNQTWQEQVFGKSKFIASPEFYVIIRHKNNANKTKFLYKLLVNIFPETWVLPFFKNDDFDFEQEAKFLEQKISACQASLSQIGIDASKLVAKPLHEFCNYWLKTETDLVDKSKYIEYKSRLHKTYRLTVPPESGDLDFWLLKYFDLFETESYISIQLQPRNAIQDRRKAENKSEILRQMRNKSKVSTVSIIQENQELARELIERPYSFDLLIYVTVIADSVKQLQDLDNLLRKPIKQAKLDPLDRQQVVNWLYSLPFAYNKLSKQEKLFANLDFAKSCFTFVDNDLGSPAGPLLASSLHNSKPVYLDEYDRAYFNNRGINFIGDSGSGKTVAAKVAIKRRLANKSNRFYIIDNTEDGWKFFIDYFAGEIIEIDKHGQDRGQKPLFSPFGTRAKAGSDQSTIQIEGILNLLAVMNDNQSKIASSEKSFLINTIKELYRLYEQPCLSDFYKLLEGSESELATKWLAVLAPYTKVCDGIYSKLMDGTESHLDDANRLCLFTFSKLNPDSNFLPVSLYLLSSFIENKVSIDKESGITLVIDEAWKIFTGKHSERGRELLTHLARAGRGLDLGLWTISQKPSDIPREIHSSASLSLCFQLKEARDKVEMSAYSNLNHNEQELLASPLIYESGNALFKGTRASGLVKLLLDPYEQVLCNSSRDFVNKRNSLFQELVLTRSADKAALEVVRRLA